MKCANLLVGGACLLLLHLEMGAARATASRPSAWLYAKAREMGLSDAGLEEIWRTGKPLVIRTQNGPNQVTTDTYTLTDDGTLRKTWLIERKEHSTYRIAENWDQPLQPIADPESLLAFLNPFLNPFGSGFAQSFFENWALPQGVASRVFTYSRSYVTNTNGGPCCQGFDGPSNPNNQSPPPSNPNQRNPNERNPNERNPSERNPNERNPNERNPSERNPNERNPSERNPNDRNPSEGNPNRPNTGSSNSNDPQWVPVPDDTSRPSVVPLPTLAPSSKGRADTVIDDFLAKVDVTTSDIKDEDGEYVRTIVDNNGRILKAKFELVETKGQEKKISTN